MRTWWVPLGLSVFFLTSVVPSDPCSKWFGSTTAETAVSARNYGETEMNRLINERACIKTYGLPGGPKELPRLTADWFKEDGNRIRGLFQSFDRLTSPEKAHLRTIEGALDYGRGAGLSSVDVSRLYRIANGWDRTQVLLYNSFLHVRSLMKESRYAEAAKAAKKAVQDAQGKFGLNDVSNLDKSTYYSRSTLINFITLQEIEAQTNLPFTLANSAADFEGLLRLLDKADAVRAAVELRIVKDPTKRILGNVARRIFNGGAPLHKKVVVIKHGDGEETAYLQGKKVYAIEIREDGAPELIEPARAAAKYLEFIKNRLAALSTDNVRFFHYAGSKEGGQLDLSGKSIALTAEEQKTIADGRPLPEGHLLSRELETADPLVLFTSPLQENAGDLQKVADDFAFSLRRAYPRAKIFRDPVTDRTVENVREVGTLSITDPAEIRVVIAEETFNVKDFKIVQNMRELLEQAKFDVQVFKAGETLRWKRSTSKGVIVITAHSDKKLANFVDALGNAGVLRNNVVILNSCRTSVTREVISKVNSEYGAIGTYAYGGKIDVRALKMALHEYCKWAVENASAGFPAALEESLAKSNLQGIWTICRLAHRWNGGA